MNKKKLQLAWKTHKLPDKLTVKVWPCRERGMRGVWLAKIVELDQLTQGDSPADAICMAGDVAKLIADECNKAEEHCWCRKDIVMGQEYGEATPAVGCCKCDTKKRLGWPKRRGSKKPKKSRTNRPRPCETCGSLGSLGGEESGMVGCTTCTGRIE